MKTKLLLFYLLFLSVSVTMAQQITLLRMEIGLFFLGNSITDGGHYHSYIWLYYMTRFPK